MFADRRENNNGRQTNKNKHTIAVEKNPLSVFMTELAGTDSLESRMVT